MDNVTKKAAGDVKVGDQLVHSDGALSTVVRVWTPRRGTVVIDHRDGGPIGLCTLKCRASRLLPVFEVTP